MPYSSSSSKGSFLRDCDKLRNGPGEKSVLEEQRLGKEDRGDMRQISFRVGNINLNVRRGVRKKKKLKAWGREKRDGKPIKGMEKDACTSKVGILRLEKAGFAGLQKKGEALKRGG